MYEAHFGLRRRPFRATPDLDSYFPASTHETALVTLQAALISDEPIVLVTAPPGLGKTLLGHRLLASGSAEQRVALVTNTHLRTRIDLLQAILYDLSLPYRDQTEQELRLAFNETCLEHFRTGERALIVIDEAQHLSPDLLEELRLWGNIETGEGRAVQVVLLGLPEIRETIRLPQLSAFQQRLTTRITLQPMSQEESLDYVRHQIVHVGGQADRILAKEALAVLTQAGNGVPRFLNQIADAAFRLAFEAEARQVDVEAVLEVLARRGEPLVDNGEPEVIPMQPSHDPQGAGGAGRVRRGKKVAGKGE